MTRRHARNIRNLVTGAHGTPAEIHVLEPNRKEPLVKTTQFFPNVVSNHKESARWLVGGASLIEFPIQITIAAIYRVRGPQPVDSKQFEH